MKHRPALKSHHFLLPFLILASAIASAQNFVDPIIGFYPGISPHASKSKNNITIAIVLPYKSFWNLTSQADYDKCSGCSWWRTMDSGAELAVQLVNNNSAILPDTMVNIVRVQGWDNVRGPGDGVGGAVVSALEVVQNTDAVAAIGETQGGSTQIVAGILSQYKIPFCGGVQNLPTLSDKRKYPYFFRVTFGNIWGQDLVTLLSRWNVKRVAIVYDMEDPESSGAYVDIKTYFQQNKIIILSYRSYHGNDAKPEFSSILTEFSRVDARYMVLCAQAWSASYTLMDLANKTGLLAPKYTWITTQPAYPPDYPGAGPDPRLDKLVGQIYVAPKPISSTDANLVAMTNLWNKMYAADPLKYQLQRFSWSNSGPFDCMGTMLYGLDKFVKSNSTFTTGMLATRQLQQYLNYTQFLKTGFNGTGMNPIQLDSNGDIASQTTFTMLNRSFWVDGGQPWFGEINKLSGEYTRLFDPVFVSGTTTPPPDGPPVIIFTKTSITTSTASGKTIISLYILGLLLTLSAVYLLHRYRDEKPIKLISIHESLVTLLGSVVLYTSMVFYMGPLSTATCTARIWCLVGGYTITIVPVVFKNLRMHVVLTTKTRLDGVFLTRVTRGLIAGVISLQIGLLGYMTGAKTVWIKEVEMPPYEFTVCEFRGNTASHIITGTTVFVHLGLLVLVYLFRNADPLYNDTPTFLTLFVCFGVGAGVLEIVPMSKDMDFMCAVTVFVVTTCGVIGMFGRRIYEAAYEDIIERGVLKRGVKSGTSGTKSTVSGHGDFGVSSAINSTVRMSGAGGLSPVAKGMKGVKSIAKQFGGGKKQAGHHHRPINCVPIAGIQVFKAKTGKTQMAWGTWNHGVVYLNSLHKHLWMSITTIEASYAFRIDSGLKIINNSPSSATQFQVVIYSPVNGVKIVFEFESAKTAIGFMSEFQTRFASLEKTID